VARKRVLGIVLAGGAGRRLGPLTADRAKPAVPFGGLYRIVARSPDGDQQEVSGTFREVVPNEKLVFTWAWRSTPERESLVTVLLGADGGGTLLTLIHEQFFDEAARDRHEHGWNGSMDKLERAVLDG